MGQASFTSNVIKSPIEVASSVANPNFGTNSIQEFAHPPRQPIPNNLPIVRNASLHRFLEKRKDRIKAKAPYPTTNSPSNPSSSNPSKPDESKLWLGLGGQSHQ